MSGHLSKMILYPFNMFELNWLASLALRDLYASPFCSADAASAKTKVVNTLSLVLMEMRSKQAKVYFGMDIMTEPEDTPSEKVPPSKENLDPRGDEIVDSPLTQDEVDCAVDALFAKERTTLWQLQRKW